jgi:two-component system, OmpR family, sensor histidine kinase BaeS
MRRMRRSLGAKLLAAQLLVIAAGAGTLFLVAVSVGPIFFRRHVRDALGIVPPEVERHLDAAFGQATLLALALGVLASVAAALAVSWLVSRRVARPVRALAAASQGIARGAYSARVPEAGEDELGLLSAAFNEMAVALELAETRRRELLSDVAHELRTPLATIKGYVDALTEGVMEPSDEIWRVLRTENERLSRLVDDLQEVSQAEERQLELRIEPLSPETLLREASEAAAPSYKAKGVQLETRSDSGLPKLAGDHGRIQEVLANLLANALRHTPPGGLVSLSTGSDPETVELVVQDSGEGIAPEHLERIFERFYRVDPARARASGGSGIGLAIALAIIEAHGGHIRAESDGPGCGARFVVTLPRVDALVGSD